MPAFCFVVSRSISCAALGGLGEERPRSEGPGKERAGKESHSARAAHGKPIGNSDRQQTARRHAQSSPMNRHGSRDALPTFTRQPDALNHCRSALPLRAVNAKETPCSQCASHVENALRISAPAVAIASQVPVRTGSHTAGIPTSPAGANKKAPWHHQGAFSVHRTFERTQSSSS